MGLPRTFLGFSSTDIHYYRLMQAWKNNDRIDFNFTDCQLSNEINSENEEYIKRKCREMINMAGRYVLLIGKDTKNKYVRWEAEVAIEKGCTIIGVNLDNSRSVNADTCPPIIRCQVSPRYSLLSKTTLRNISGFLINKSGFKLYQYSKAS